MARDLSTYKIMWSDLGLRPLKARSVLASAILAQEDGLSSRKLVKFAELFEIPEGTARVTLSRMVAAGDLVIADGVHWVAGRLAERRVRQSVSLDPKVRPWDGTFLVEVVSLARRDAQVRMSLRTAMRNLRFGTYNEALYMRPNNLDLEGQERERIIVRTQCEQLVARPQHDPGVLVRRLWDIGGWQSTANDLRLVISRSLEDAEQGRAQVLAPGFMLGAAITHHLMADPLLPEELLPPTWPGEVLRKEWENFDQLWRQLLRNWLEE